MFQSFLAETKLSKWEITKVIFNFLHSIHVCFNMTAFCLKTACVSNEDVCRINLVSSLEILSRLL